MNIKRVKQGAKITLASGIYTILLGIYYISFMKFNMRINFENTKQVWGFFLKYDSDVSHLFFLFNIILGIALISIGIHIIYLSYIVLIRKEKITWVILFLSGIISWTGLLIISILFQNIVQIILSFIGWLVFIIGMILPISYYIEKPYKEY
jgi:hypothetical protein